MGFSIDMGNTQRIGSFEQAALFFANTKPVKSSYWESDTRPLGRRSDTAKRIVCCNDSEGEAVKYQLVYHATPLVTYFSDGRIGLASHSSKSSSAFTRRYLPYGIALARENGDMLFGVLTRKGYGWYQGDYLEITPDETSRGVWNTPKYREPRKGTQLCLKTVRRIRTAAKPFLVWVQATRKLEQKTQLKPCWQGTLPDSIEQIENPEYWGDFEPLMTDAHLWFSKVYRALGALKTVEISPDTPPRR